MKSSFDQQIGLTPAAVSESVRKATIRLADSRKRAASISGEQWEAMRHEASLIRTWVLDNLRSLLIQLETQCTANGIHVHWAADAQEACNLTLEICNPLGQSQHIVKAKSMITEEIHLNAALCDAGHEVVETDLGEFVIQLDQDTPSHIVAPIIHRSRTQVAKSFQRAGIGGESSDPSALAMEARSHLRKKFQKATVGISGVNFAISESGTLVIVENEGNNRLCATAPKIHIALMGIEKVIPRDADLPLFLKLLAASATGQPITVYTHIVRGPRKSDEVDGSDAVHLILVDNGRSKALSSPLKDALKCIRCGACCNVCPVFRCGGGHPYQNVYSGPIGAILAPALQGVAEYGHLSFSSTLCGECTEVCPVEIPIDSLLLEVRKMCADAGLTQDRKFWKTYSFAARNPLLWKSGMLLLPLAAQQEIGPFSQWVETHAPIASKEECFRDWWDERAR